MPPQLEYIAWTILFVFLGGLLGMLMVLGGSLLLPRLINLLTPNVDEEKEIARGNTAVAEYFGRVVAAAIIGILAGLT